MARNPITGLEEPDVTKSPVYNPNTGSFGLSGATPPVTTPPVTPTPEIPGVQPATTSGLKLYNQQTGQWAVDPNVTQRQDASISGSLNKLTAENSPLMQQARTTALQQMNRRGLANSSMAVGASQDAAYRAALPIAQQESQQIAAENLSRQGFGQQASLLGAQQIGAASESEKSYTRDIGSENAAFGIGSRQLGLAASRSDQELASATQRYGTDVTSRDRAAEIGSLEKRHRETTGKDMTQNTIKTVSEVLANKAKLIAEISANKDMPSATKASTIANIEKQYGQITSVISDLDTLTHDFKVQAATYPVPGTGQTAVSPKIYNNQIVIQKWNTQSGQFDSVPIQAPQPVPGTQSKPPSLEITTEDGKKAWYSYVKDSSGKWVATPATTKPTGPVSPMPQ